jgi:hypothetical protein
MPRVCIVIEVSVRRSPIMRMGGDRGIAGSRDLGAGRA